MNAFETPLTLAIKEGRINHVYNLIYYTHAPLNETNKFGSTPLMLACFFQETQLADFILQQNYCDIGLDIVNSNGDTALILACQSNMPNIAMKILNKNGLISSLRNNKNKNALDFAIENRMFLISKTIIDHYMELLEPIVVFKK